MDTDSLIADFAARLRSADNLPVLHPPYGVTTRPPEPQEIPPENRVTRHPSSPPPRPQLPEPTAQQVEMILQASAAAALHRVKRLGRTATDQMIKDAFMSAVVANCSSILAAAEARIGAIQAGAEGKVKIKEARQRARERIAKELVASRKRLSELRRSVAKAQNAATQSEATLRELESSCAQEKLRIVRLAAVQEKMYPTVPEGTIRPDKDGKGLPSTPGIYFLWRNGMIDYVGKSIRLCDRVSLGTHHVLNADHLISFVQVEEGELTWAECYYIGISQPAQNFGRAKRLAVLATGES